MGTVYTIGHSNRPIEEFLALLREHGVERVLDIRTVPKSRHNPQFGQDQLPASLEAAGIGYAYIRELAACGAPARTRRTAPGATPRSAAMPTICRRPNSTSTSRRSPGWRRDNAAR